MSPPRVPDPLNHVAHERHPAADDLLKLADGELTPDLAARLDRHLEGCSECRELVRDLAAFPDLAAAGEGARIGPEELRANLGELRARTLAEEIALHGAETGPERAATPPRRGAAPAATIRVRLPRGSGPCRLARAAVLVALLGWGLYGSLAVEDLEDELAGARSRLAETASSLTRPRPNAGVVQLPEIDNPLRGPTSGPSLGPAGLTVVLDPDDALPPGRYSAEIRSTSGALVRRIEGLEPQPLGLSFYLPPAALPPGEYSIRLRRDDGAEWPTVWRLALQL